jgi:hypothetical protein
MLLRFVGEVGILLLKPPFGVNGAVGNHGAAAAGDYTTPPFYGPDASSNVNAEVFYCGIAGGYSAGFT